MVYRAIIFLFCLWLASTVRAIDIIPTPQDIFLTGDTLFLDEINTLQIHGSPELRDQAMGINVLQLLEECNRELFNIRTGGNPLAIFISLDTLSRIKEEGYEMTISEQGIFIEGADEAGVLYAAQTLVQIFYGNVSEGFLPGMQLVDYPDFAFRGVLDDISRGPLPNLQFMKKQIRRFAMLKINVLAFYIEHVLRTEKHHAYAPASAMTIEELEELSDYAAGYNIKFMGSFQSLGHFRNILKHPEYSHLGVSDRMLNPGDSASIAFLTDVYEEIIPTAQHEIFNINCDETYDLSRGERLRALADSIGEGGVYAHHIVPLLEYVEQQGKRPALWGDVLLHHPEVFEQIPDKTVVFTWDYSEREDFSAWIDPIVDRGFDFVACTGILNSYRLWPDLDEARGNIRSFSREAFTKGGLGILTTVWDDGGRHFFSCDWQGIAAASEYSWNPDGAVDATLENRFSRIFLHDRENLFSQLLTQLETLQSTDRLYRLDNQLLNTSYRVADDDPIFIDTSELQAIMSRLVDADLLLDRMDDRSLYGHVDWRSDLAYWKFKVHQLIEATRLPLNLIEIREAFGQLKDSPKQTLREKLIELKEFALRNELVWQKIHDDFTSFWNNENRPYWFDEAIAPYKDKIATWQGLKDFMHWATLHGINDVPAGIKVNFDYRPNAGSYITYWLGAGPFYAEGESPILVDYFAREGGEKEIKPGAIDYFLTQNDTYKGWDKIISQHPSAMYFSDFYQTPDRNVAYASVRFEMEQDMNIRYELNCPGEFILFQDSRSIQKSGSQQEVYQGELHFKKGKNYLLFKMVEPPSEPWKFSFRILNERMRNNKYKYYILK